MASLKCQSCGVVNFANETVCKQCDTFLPKAPETPETHLTAWSILKNYDCSLLFILFPIIFIGLFLIVDVGGMTVRRRGVSVTPSDSPIALFLAIGTGILAFAALWWRVAAVRKAFAAGQAVVGRITNIRINQANQSGTIFFAYPLNNQEYQSKVNVAGRIVGVETLKSFRIGDTVELIVDRTNPKRAFVKRLYLSPRTQID